MKANKTLHFMSTVDRVLQTTPLLTVGILPTAPFIASAAGDVEIFVSKASQ